MILHGARYLRVAMGGEGNRISSRKYLRLYVCLLTDSLLECVHREIKALLLTVITLSVISLYYFILFIYFILCYSVFTIFLLLLLMPEISMCGIHTVGQFVGQYFC